jgi:hypothetical protein
LEGIALLVGVDRILELFRTATNVTGDLVASVVIDRFVSNPKTYAEEMSIQQQVEDEQEKTGEDVITKEIEPVGIPLQPSFLNRLRNVLFHKD